MVMKEFVGRITRERKRRQKIETAKKVAAGAGIAAAIGAAAGILLAPKSGKETRADIKNKASEVTEKTRETVHEKYDKVKEAAEQASKGIHDVIREARAKKSDAPKAEAAKDVTPEEPEESPNKTAFD